MFAVMGATGKVGGAVARALSAMGKSVRVVVRDRAKGEPWSQRGCDVAVAESGNTADLARALSGAEGAFVMLPPNFDPSPGFPEARTLIAAIREALMRANPAKVVALSTIGAEVSQPNLLNQLGLMEQSFGSLPMPVTFLRAAWFMENAALDIGSARDSGVIASYLQPLDRPVPMIATDDVGRTAAESLLDKWIGHRVIELEGLQRVSPNDIAEAFAKALGWPVKPEIVPRDKWEALFRTQGMQNPTPRMQMLDGFNAGWIDFGRYGAEARKGRLTIEQTIAALVDRARRI